MNYEYLDLGLILINLLFCGLLLHRTNKIQEKIKFLEKVTTTSVRNPKLARKLLNETSK